MDILGQSAIVVALVSFSLGISVLARDVRNKLFVHYWLLCLGVSGWALFFVLSRLQFVGLGGRYFPYAEIHWLFNLWLGPAALALIRSDRQNRLDPKHAWLFWASIVIAFLLSVALMFGWEKDAPFLKQVYLFTPGLIAVQAVLLTIAEFRNANVSPIQESRRRWPIYLGALVVLSTSVQDHIPWIGTALPVVGNLLLTVYMIFLSRAVTQLRFLNMGELVSRFFVHLGIAILLTGVYLILLKSIDDKPALFLFNSFVISFLVLMVLDPLRAGVRFFTDRIFLKRTRRLKVRLQSLSESWTNISQVDPILEGLATVMQQIMGVDRFAIYIRSQDWTRFDLKRASGSDTWPKEILAESLIIKRAQHLKSEGQIPVILEKSLEEESDRSLSKAKRVELQLAIDELKRWGASLWIPLLVDHECLGFICALPQSPPAEWGGRWNFLSQVYPCLEQAAQGIRNTEMFARHREQVRMAAIGEMAAGLAHEIRNPLGSIKGASQLLESDAKNASKWRTVILEEVDRLNSVVTQFLDFAKPESLKLSELELMPFLREATERIRIGMPSGFQLELCMQETAQNIRVLASSEFLFQVILNLVKNSVDALQTGSFPQRVEISAQQAGEFVRISVSDVGPGMEKDILDKIFIPFFTTKQRGTGLGLPMCLKIIEAHRGRLEVTSVPNSKTQVTIILPIWGRLNA